MATPGKRRRRSGLKMSQVAAIGFKNRRPPHHRATTEWRLSSQARLEQVEEEIGRLQSRVAGRVQHEAQRDAPNGVKLPEQVARDYIARPQLYLGGRLLLPLWPIQEEFVRQLGELERRPRYGSRGIIFRGELGLGKTAMVEEHIHQETLQRIRCMPRGGEGQRFGHPTLVVAPKGVYMQWMEEARKFFPADLMTYDSLDSSGDTRQLDVERIMTCLDFVVVSYPTLTGAYRQRDTFGRTLFEIPWYRVVLDEGTWIVNEGTEVFAACAAIKCERRIFISGTPMPNVRSTEMSAILSFLGCDAIQLPRLPAPTEVRDSRNMWMLLPDSERNEADTTMTTTAGYTAEMATAALNQWRLVLDTFCLSLDSVLQAMGGNEAELVPPAVAALRSHHTEIVWVTLLPAERYHYENLVNRAQHECDKASRRRGQFRLKWLSRLLQACTSLNLLIAPPLMSDEARAMSSKMIAVLRYEGTRMAPGEKGLVFDMNLGPLYELAYHLGQRRISYEIICGDMTTRQRCEVTARVADANSADPRLTLMPMRIASGVNALQGSSEHGGGANHVLFLAGFWNEAVEAQSLARAARPGQTRPVYSVKFVVKDSVEEVVLDRNRTKRDMWRTLTQR